MTINIYTHSRPKKSEINNKLRELNINPEELNVVLRRAVDNATHIRMHGVYIDTSAILSDAKYYIYLALTTKSISVET